MKRTARSLVTGAAGFIGSHVVDELVAMGHDVVALDDLSGGFRANVNPQAIFVEGSVVDHALVDTLFATHRFDYVFHLAAYAAEGLSHFIKRFNYTNNLLGSVSLLNASVNVGTVKCFVFTSSIAVYGNGQLPMTERMVPQPEDSYGIAKYAVELELHETARMFGLPFVIFRPHNVYGERQNTGDPYRNVIGIFMNRLLQGQPLTIFGDGSQSRAFSHISDVAPVIARCVEREAVHNHVFNVGADTPHTVLTLARAVATAMGVEAQIVHLPARNEVQHAFADHSEVRKHFADLIHDVPLDAGLRTMAQWVREVGPRQGRPFEGLEVRKNLPASWEALTAKPST